jgi:hypothetical protein
MKTKILILSLLACSLQLSAESKSIHTHTANGVTTTTTIINGKTTTTQTKAVKDGNDAFVKGLNKALKKEGVKDVSFSMNVSAGTNPANSFSTSDMSWVDQKIEEIKPQRNGMSNNRLASIKSPFIIVKKEIKDSDKKAIAAKDSNAKKDDKNSPLKRDMSKEPLTLQIVLNSSALINGKWLKENEKTRGYTLTQIQSSYVVLERKKKKIKLFISQKSDNLNISTK